MPGSSQQKPTEVAELYKDLLDQCHELLPGSRRRLMRSTSHLAKLIEQRPEKQEADPGMGAGMRHGRRGLFAGHLPARVPSPGRDVICRSRSSAPTSASRRCSGRGRAIYGGTIAEDVSAERLRRFFTKMDGGLSDQ